MYRTGIDCVGIGSYARIRTAQWTTACTPTSSGPSTTLWSTLSTRNTSAATSALTSLENLEGTALTWCGFWFFHLWSDIQNWMLFVKSKKWYLHPVLQVVFSEGHDASTLGDALGILLSTVTPYLLETYRFKVELGGHLISNYFDHLYLHDQNLLRSTIPTQLNPHREVNEISNVLYVWFYREFFSAYLGHILSHIFH